MDLRYQPGFGARNYARFRQLSSSQARSIVVHSSLGAMRFPVVDVEKDVSDLFGDPLFPKSTLEDSSSVLEKFEFDLHSVLPDQTDGLLPESSSLLVSSKSVTDRLIETRPPNPPAKNRPK